MSFSIRKYPVKIDGDEHEIEFSKPVGAYIVILACVGALCLLGGCSALPAAVGASTALPLFKPPAQAYASTFVDARGQEMMEFRLEDIERRLENERRRDMRREMEDLEDRLDFIERSQSVPPLPTPYPELEQSGSGGLLRRFVE